MPQKGTWKVDKQSLHNNRSKESMKMSRRSEIWGHLLKTHTLPMATHSQEASQSYDLFPELWGFQPYRSFTVEMSPLKYMVLNTPRKTMELQGTENLLVKCLCTDWLDPKTSTKTANWKAHGLWVKGIHLLKYLLWRQETAGTLPRDWVTGSGHLYDFRPLCKVEPVRSLYKLSI